MLRRNGLHEADVNLSGRSTDFDPYYTSIPFFYHCRSTPRLASMAGFFIDNGYKGNFEFEGRETYRYRFSGGQYTEYVFAGPTMKEVLEGYAFITGKMQPPPIWALGHHQSRWGYRSARAMRRVAKEARRRRIPTDVLHFDIDYMDGYRVFSWHPRRFPEPARLIAELRDAGFRVVPIVDPGVKVDERYPVYNDGLAKDAFLRREDGSTFALRVWPKAAALPDFGRPEVRTWWAGWHKPLLDAGVAGIWNDMNEPAGWQRDVRVGRLIVPLRKQDLSAVRAARQNGINYGQFIHGLKVAGVDLDRKILADIALQDPAAFSRLADTAKKAVAS